MAEITGASVDATVQGTVGTHQTTVNVDGESIAKRDDKGVIGKHDINRSTVSKRLAKIGWSNAPLDTFLRNIGKGDTNSDKFEFASVAARGVECVVGADTAALTTAATEITLSSGVHCLSKDGVLVVPTYGVSGGAGKAVGTGVTASGKPLMLHIVSVNYAGNKITVVPINASSSALIKAGTKMYRSGIACDQDVAITEDPQAMPIKDYNLCQRFLCTISENAYQALQEKDVEYGLADFKEQAILDFRLQSEAAAIFGGGAVAKENFVDPVTMKRKLHMRGVLDFNIQEITKGADEEMDTFLNRVMQDMFSVNNGSEERILLYGAGFATKLANSKWWSKQLEANKTEMKWGVTWKMVESNFGTLRGIMDPALSLFGGYSNCALVIDPRHIRVIEQVPMQERKLDLQKSGIRNSHDVVLEESITLELTNPKAHGLLIINE